MSALDQGPTTAAVPSQAAARPAAQPTAHPATLPRDPRERLAALFDPGTLEVAAGRDRGTQRGCRGHRPGARRERGGVRLRRAGPGRRDGHRGLRRDRRGVLRGDLAWCADRGPVALRRGPAGRGRGQPARRGHRIRGDDPGLRAGAADLGGARAGRGRCRLRSRADRHRDPVRAGTHLRHRPGRGALSSPARTWTWNGSAGPSRTAAGPAWCTS